MKKKVDKDVNKVWAKQAKEILTGNSPDTTSLFTKLLTITREEQQKLKTMAARARFDSALNALMDGVKFGWAHGISEKQARFTRPQKGTMHPRVYALLPLAIAAGESIGKSQLLKINRQHGIPKPGTFAPRP